MRGAWHRIKGQPVRCADLRPDRGWSCWWWAGRALGTQNTAQNIAGSLTPPLLGALIGGAGYGLGFAIAAVFPLLAIGATPFAAEAAHKASTSGRTQREA